MIGQYERVIEDLFVEVARASQHKPYNSAHEGYAVILEELCELWEEVRKKRSDRNVQAMRSEALQVAVTAIRFAVDLCDLSNEAAGG